MSLDRAWQHTGGSLVRSPIACRPWLPPLHWSRGLPPPVGLPAPHQPLAGRPVHLWGGAAHNTAMRRGWGSPRLHPPPPASPDAAASVGTSGEASPNPSSPSSPPMFHLSPEAHLKGGLGVPTAQAAAAWSADDGGSEDDSEDLSSWLGALREKYGLQDAAAVPLPALAGTPMPAAQADAAPSVHIRVHVTSTSTAGGGELSLPDAAAVPQLSPGKAQLKQEEEAVGAAVTSTLLPTEPASASRQAGQLVPQSSMANAVEQQQQQEPQTQPQPQPHLDETAEAELLGAELDAELTALEELQCQLAKQQHAQGSGQAQMQQQGLPAPPQQPGTAATSHGSTAAAATGHTVERHGSSVVEDAVECAQPAGLDAPQLQLPWASLHELLVERGFPGVLPAAGADVGAGSSELQEPQPDPATLFTALHSLLQDQARAKLHQERLAEAAKAAARREGALVSSFTAAAKQRDAEIAKWKRLALDNQRAAREAQQAGGSLSQSREQLAAEARQLQGTVARLQAALHRKVRQLFWWPCTAHRVAETALAG